jgi:Trk-type K+ transport system membrane component
VSGFTTTGFRLVPENAVLPQSLLLYRSIIELAGGIGIVFLLLVFFLRGEYPGGYPMRSIFTSLSS